MKWQPIETAPKDGRQLWFMNMDNGLEDFGHWCDYSDRPESVKEDWTEELKRDQGEWCSERGNFPMTHWREIPT